MITKKRALLILSFVVVLGVVGLVFTVFGGSTGSSALADNDIAGNSCKELPSHADLSAQLSKARDFIDEITGTGNGGFNFHMWGTIVNRDGVVCAVAFTGENRGDEWPGSRVISAQKANTANAFSLPGFALSTANLFAPVQPGGSLFGLQESNPVDTDVAYGGNAKHNGQPNDHMVGNKIGGVNVFGGGLALYDSKGNLLGAIGVSGDTSCADHNIAWRTRNGLGLDNVPAGVNTPDPDKPNDTDDNIIFDITNDDDGHPVSGGGFGHAHCLNAAIESAIADALPAIPAIPPTP